MICICLNVNKCCHLFLLLLTRKLLSFLNVDAVETVEVKSQCSTLLCTRFHSRISIFGPINFPEYDK